MMVTVSQTAMVQPVMQSMVPMRSVLMVLMVSTMDRDSGVHTTRLGASLRDRATLPSPLRGLDPSGGYPSRLHSLRSFRASLGRRFAALTAACPTAAPCGQPEPGARHALRPPRDGAARHARPGPRFARPGRLRRRWASPVPASPCSALRRAPVPAQVRTLPHEPSAARFARLPSALAAVPATQAPWRLPSAGFAGVDSPCVPRPLGACSYALRRVGFHTRRIDDAACGMDHHRRDRLRLIMIVRSKVRV